MRVASIDLGTNSTRLLVADVVDGRLEEVVRHLRITRLGEGVDERRVLLPVGVARVHNCLVDYRRELERLGAERTLAIATSAVRDAGNGEAFLGEIEWSYGVATRLLSGHEEAELMLRGVSSDLRVDEGTLVLDIGGGSTEFVVRAAGGVVFIRSLQIGCVRLTERFLAQDPPTAAALEACARHVRDLLPEMTIRRAIGVAGTLTTLAALDLGLPAYDPVRVHRHRLSRAAVERELERIAALPLAERRRLPALEPGRAEVIVGGAGVLREVMAHYDLNEIEVSERDILHGAALAAAELPARVEGQAPPGAFTAC